MYEKHQPWIKDNFLKHTPIEHLQFIAHDRTLQIESCEGTGHKPSFMPSKKAEFNRN